MPGRLVVAGVCGLVVAAVTMVGVPAATATTGPRGPELAPRAGTGPFAGGTVRLGPVPDDAVSTRARVTATKLPARPRATAVAIDDRRLVRSGAWTSVTSAASSNRTLSSSVRVGATLRSRTAASAGGAVVVQTGPRRGTVEVRVAGKVRARASTAAARVATRSVPFSGAGTVEIRVAAAGRGVFVDALRLNGSGVAPGSGSTAPLLPGALLRLGVNGAGQGPDDDVLNAAVSPGGTMVAFWSRARNLVPNVTDGARHLFIASVATGKVIGVADTSPANELSNDNEGVSGGRALAWSPVEAGRTDAQYLLFASKATNLTPSVPEGPAPYLFVKNLDNGAVVGLLSGVDEAAWSPDGTKVAVVTSARYGNDPNIQTDVWSLDLAADTSSNLTPVSSDASWRMPVSDGGVPTWSEKVGWARDSRRLVFTSMAATLVPGDSNAAADVFVKDLGTGAVTVVSSPPTGRANSYSADGVFSPAGTQVAFTSNADNLVRGDTNSAKDVFVKDLASGQVTLESNTSGGQPSFFDHSRPHWSPDGRRLAFASVAVDLMPEPTIDTNSRPDVYVRTLATGLNQLASVTADRRLGTSLSSLMEIGGYDSNAWLPHGKGIVFLSRSTNFAPTDSNGNGADLFLKVL